MIASVIEALLAECVHQAIPFGFAREVRRGVAGDDHIKELRLIRNLPRKFCIRTGRQHDRPSQSPLLLDICQEFQSIRQSCCIQRNSPGDLLLRDALPLASHTGSMSRHAGFCSIKRGGIPKEDRSSPACHPGRRPMAATRSVRERWWSRADRSTLAVQGPH